MNLSKWVYIKSPKYMLHYLIKDKCLGREHRYHLLYVKSQQEHRNKVLFLLITVSVNCVVKSSNRRLTSSLENSSKQTTEKRIKTLCSARCFHEGRFPTVKFSITELVGRNWPNRAHICHF